MSMQGRPSQNQFGLPEQIYNRPVTAAMRIKQAMSMVKEQLDDFEIVYTMLSDEESKDIFLTVLAYRGLGWRYVRLPLDTPEYHSIVSELQQSAESVSSEKKIQTQDGYTTLSLVNLSSYGYDVDIFIEKWGAFSEFIYSQYEYRSQEGVLSVGEGDTALDCGACWGGTSLYFGSKVGSKGKVVSYEFVP
jgi:hypothetical protein